MRTSADRGASLLGRALLRLRAERGDTLMEVLVAALMVALIATASLGGFGDVGKLSESQRNEEQAATLAQQDQARMRGLTISQLASTGTGTGNVTSTTQVDGTTYKITSAAAFVSGSTGTSACSGSSGADEVQTTSTVTWGQNNGGRNPVVVHGLITPAEGGALVATVVDPTGAGLAGVTVSMSGPSAVSPVTTDSSGCVIWTGLAAGSYTVSYTPPSGTWVTSGSVAPASQTWPVTAAATTHATPVQIGQAASILASFSTTFNSQTLTNESDQFVLTGTGLSGSPLTFGSDSTKTNNTFASTIATSNNLYPYPSSASTDDYFAWAGGCSASAAQPPLANTPAITLTGGQVNPITIQEPALIVLPYTESTSTSQSNYDDNNSAITYSTSGFPRTSQWTNPSSSSDYGGSEHDSSTTNATATVSFTGTGIAWIGTTGANNGYATVQVDSGSAQSVDLYSASTQYNQTIWSTSGLSAGSHTLKITVSGQNGGPLTYNWYTHQWSNSGGPQVSVDEFTITSVTLGSPALMTTAPTVTVTETDTGCGNNEDWPPTQVPTATQGALAFPGEPYGTYTVCVDNGTNHVTITGVSNKDYTTGTTVIADIYPSPPVGTYGTGKCA